MFLSNDFAISRNIFPGTNGTDWSILNCKNGLTVLRSGDLASVPLIPKPWKVFSNTFRSLFCGVLFNTKPVKFGSTLPKMKFSYQAEIRLLVIL